MVLLMLMNTHSFSDHMRVIFSFYLIYNLLQASMQPIGSHYLFSTFLFIFKLLIFFPILVSLVNYIYIHL